MEEEWYKEINDLKREFMYTRSLLQQTITLARELNSYREARELQRELRELETNFLAIKQVIIKYSNLYRLNYKNGRRSKNYANHR